MTSPTNLLKSTSILCLPSIMNNECVQFGVIFLSWSIGRHPVCGLINGWYCICNVIFDCAISYGCIMSHENTCAKISCPCGGVYGLQGEVSRSVYRVK
jgi:hypothetical protein